MPLTFEEAAIRTENRRANRYPHLYEGGNVVSDRDEDYLFDALFDVPNT